MTHRAGVRGASTGGCQFLDPSNNPVPNSRGGPYRSMATIQSDKPAKPTMEHGPRVYSAFDFIGAGLSVASTQAVGVVGAVLLTLGGGFIGSNIAYAGVGLVIAFATVLLLGLIRGLSLSVSECNSLLTSLLGERAANKYIISAALRPSGRYRDFKPVCVFVVSWSDRFALQPGTRVYISSHDSGIDRHVGYGIVREMQTDGQYVVSLDHNYDDAVDIVDNLLSATMSTASEARAKVRISPAPETQLATTSSQPITDNTVAPIAVPRLPSGEP